MALSKLRCVLFFALAIALGGGNALTQFSTTAIAREADSEKAKTLLNEKAELLSSIYALGMKEYEGGTISVDKALEPQRLLLQTEIERCITKEELNEHLRKLLVVAKEMEDSVSRRLAAGTISKRDVQVVTAARMDVELVLAREDPANLEKAIKAKVDVGYQLVDTANLMHKAGEASSLDVAVARKQLFQEKLQLCETKADKAAIAKQILGHFDTILDLSKRNFEAGELSSIDLCAVRAEYIEAQMLTPELKDEDLKALLRKKLDALEEMSEAAQSSFKNATCSRAEVLSARYQVLEAKGRLCESKQERLANLKDQLQVVREHEEVADALASIGKISKREGLLAKVAPLTVQIAIERMQAE